MRKVHNKLVPLIALSAGVPLLACGSSSSSSSPSPTAPADTAGVTHAELVARADAICKHANSQIVATRKVPASGTTPPFTSVVRLLNEELPILTAEVSALQRLAPSSADRPLFEEYVRATATEIASAGRVRGASLNKDAAAYRVAALETLTQSARLVRAAGQLGLVECAKRAEPQG